MTPSHRIPLLPLALATVLLAPQATAEERRGHGSHVHGMGSLNIAQEGGDLQMELHSAAANIVGFEHAPRWEEEHEAVRRAVETLEEGGALFGLPAAAGCALEHVAVATPLLKSGAGHEADHLHEGHHQEGGKDSHRDDHAGHHETPGEDERHGHAEGHGHDARDGDAIGEAHHAHDAATHSDITAEYHFHCEWPDRLEGVEVGLFEAFPATTRLRVQFVTDEGQGAAELTPENRLVRF